MGSPLVLFSPYSAALAAAQGALAVPLLPSILMPRVHDPYHAMLKYGSQTARWGCSVPQRGGGP